MILNWWQSRTPRDLKLKALFFIQRTGLCFFDKKSCCKYDILWYNKPNTDVGKRGDDASRLI